MDGRPDNNNDDGTGDGIQGGSGHDNEAAASESGGGEMTDPSTQDQQQLLSPQGAVPTRTRSARKKRKLQQDEEEEDQQKQQSPPQQDHRPPQAKRARRSAAAGPGDRGGDKDEDVKMAVVETLDFDEREQQVEVEQAGNEEDSKLPATAAPMELEEPASDDAPTNSAESVAVDPALAAAMTDPTTGPFAAATPSAATTGPGLPLRLPALQTPGKHPPPEPSPETVPMPRRADRLEHAVPRGRGLGLNFGDVPSTAQGSTGTAASAKPPPPAAVPAALDTEASAAEASTPTAISRRRAWVEEQLQRTAVWVLLLGILQLLCFPTLNLVVRSSNHLLHFYQGLPLIGRRPVAPSPADGAQAEWRAQQLQIWDNLRQDVRQAHDELREAVEQYRDEREQLAERVREADRHCQGQAERWNRAMRVARAYPLDDDESGDLDGTASGRSPQAVAALDIAALQELVSSHGMWGAGVADGNLQEEALLDISFLAGWKLPKLSDMTCPVTAPTEAALDPVQHEQVLEALQAKVQNLRQLAAESARQIQANASLEELYRQWVQKMLLSQPLVKDDDNPDAPTFGNEYQSLLLEKQQVPKPNRTKKVPLRGASLEAIENMIAARMEMERADQTGRTDYASILNGAAVLEHSPSLKDRLPVWNRLLQFWSWRSYGLGPEAAITPVPPPHMLGHCWSFAKDPNSKHSAYATLTLRLSAPILLQTVSIEHPPAEVTDRRGSAIRQFRVVGFEDSNALGVPWSLGSFEYQLDGAIRQEFRLQDKVRGEDVPVLRALGLWIDSNWGEDYACLYRIRAYGVEVS